MITHETGRGIYCWIRGSLKRHLNVIKKQSKVTPEVLNYGQGKVMLLVVLADIVTLSGVIKRQSDMMQRMSGPG